MKKIINCVMAATLCIWSAHCPNSLHSSTVTMATAALRP